MLTGIGWADREDGLGVKHAGEFLVFIVYLANNDTSNFFYRQELATREHMIDHGQVGPETPASAFGISPAVSRRPSTGAANFINPVTGLRSRPVSRRQSESVALGQTCSVFSNRG